ncbi:hypothetical protein DM867_05710 [Halosegnis rubeus]|uniref:TrbL/VirB6 plasmid conjugal transfer protein n=1 Tax=Halosegnis rubeus TaxID=2212850 RepID=A0A5N5U7Q6_9EURY|nr:hypothetical protein [Halosegnis rubeus]KAB7514614.1 hypothetical protein DM867_05710 [Halosegnis rubeus]
MNPFKILVIVLLITGLAVPATATTPVPENESEDEEEEDSETVIDFSGLSSAIDDLVDEIADFTGTWDTTLEELLTGVLFHPFNILAQQLVRQFTTVLINTPSVYPNPVVEEIHRDTLLVAYTVAGLVFPATGILYMYGSVLGVSYQEVRMILPRFITGLVFATVSLPLLQYTVELSDALVYAFAPSGLTMSVTQVAGLSVSLVLVWVINAFLLLALVVVFIIRSVYILFVAAISPLLALAWAFPKTKRYADTFISGYWTALAMAPLDVLVLKFILSLLTAQGSGVQGLSNWILGVAGFTLLLWVPYQLYGASQAILGQAYVVSRSIKTRVKQRKQAKKREEYREKRLKQGRQAANQDRNKFDYRGEN